MNTQEIKEYIISQYEGVTEANFNDFERKLFCEFDDETGERESHRWWDEIEVTKKMGDKTFVYWWATANRDESVQDLGWEFDINTVRELFVSDLEVLNLKVISYCKIPEEITKGHHIEHTTCDSYIKYQLEDEGEEELSDWIRTTYPELVGIEFLIHIDY